MEITGLYINVIISIISLLPLAAGVEEPSSVGLHMTCTPTCTLTEWDENSCEPGFSRDCSQESPYSTRKCCLCPAGTFMFKDNHCSQCLPYTDCSGRVVTSNGSHTMDRECSITTSTTTEQDRLEEGTTLPPRNTATQSTLPPRSTTTLSQITNTTNTPSPPLMDDVTTEGVDVYPVCGKCSTANHDAVIVLLILVIVFLVLLLCFRGKVEHIRRVLQQRIYTSREQRRQENKEPPPGDAESRLPLSSPQNPENIEISERRPDERRDGDD